MTLTDAERQRIELEERYRLEIQKKLQAPVTWWERLWSMLNQPIGTWMASVVLAGLVAWGVNWYRESEQSKKDRIASLNQISQEIAYRVSLIVDGRILHELGHGDLPVVDAVIPITGALGEGSKYPPAFPEFAGRSVLGLVAQLHTYCKDKQRIVELMTETAKAEALDKIERPDVTTRPEVAKLLRDTALALKNSADTLIEACKKES
jgi:hypothetical protein